MDGSAVWALGEPGSDSSWRIGGGSHASTQRTTCATTPSVRLHATKCGNLRTVGERALESVAVGEAVVAVGVGNDALADLHADSVEIEDLEVGVLAVRFEAEEHGVSQSLQIETHGLHGTAAPADRPSFRRRGVPVARRPLGDPVWP